MNVIAMVYTILGIFTFLALGVVLFVIAGKEIYIAFYQRIFPKGCEVWMTNHNRQISRHYKVPKDGVFRIGGKSYITNPDKVLSLSNDLQREVSVSMQKKEDRLKGHIKVMEDKAKLIQAQINLIDKEKTKDAEPIKLQYMSDLQSLKSKIDILKGKLKERMQVYYYKRRASFFYIEDDPVPKDFHEWYTEMDSIMLDNMMARAQTKDPRAVRDLEKALQTQKYVTIGIIVVAAVLAFLVFQNNGMLRDIAAASGVALTV